MGSQIATSDGQWTAGGSDSGDSHAGVFCSLFDWRSGRFLLCGTRRRPEAKTGRIEIGARQKDRLTPHCWPSVALVFRWIPIAQPAYGIGATAAVAPRSNLAGSSPTSDRAAVAAP